MKRLHVASMFRRQIQLVAAIGLILLLFVEVQAGAIRSSSFNTSTLARNDDGSTGLVSTGFNSNFFGTTYSQLYVNNNGNVTFDSALGTFTPFNLSTTNRAIIAPFFADVDTRGPGNPVTYGQGTVDGRAAFGVNWVDVAHYSASPPLNSFQLVLINRSDTGAGNFDIEFNYDKILWESGTASGGNSLGLGGSAARAGYSSGGVTPTSFELAGSAVNGAFLDGGPVGTALIRNSLNSSVDGRYVFNVRNGSVVPPTPPAVPEPSSLAVFGLGALGLVSVRLRKQKHNV